MRRQLLLIAFLVLAASCAGISKSCSQFSASTIGSDWIVVQVDMQGHPFNCWQLHGAVVESTEGGNVDWKDPTTGHLVTLTGWENRVQVLNGGDFAGAAALLGVDSSKCGNGRYPK